MSALIIPKELQLLPLLKRMINVARLFFGKKSLWYIENGILITGLQHHLRKATSQNSEIFHSKDEVCS